MRKFILLVTVLAVFFCGRSLAEPLEITITIPRTASDLATTTYTYDVIDVDTPVDNTNGVNIVQNGPPGQSSSLFIRGTESDHSLITLNGIPIKDHSTPSGADDFSQHNLIGIDYLTIIKGPMSNTHGPNAAGGVIDMHTDTYGQSYIDLSIGSNNLVSKEISVVDNDQTDRHNFKITANQTSTDGVSVYAEGEEKDPHEANTFNISYDYIGNKYILKLNKIKDTNEMSLDSGSADVLNYTGDWEWNNNQIDFQMKNTRVVLNNSKHDRSYKKNGVVDTYNSESNTYLTQHTFNKDTYDYSVGWEYNEASADFSTNINNYQSSVNENRYTTGLFFEVDKEYFMGTILSFSSRFDSISDFDNQISSRIGISHDGYRASYSQGYRLPTLYEMYGIDSYGYQGNANLNAEDIDSYEVGYKIGNFDTALFYIEESNAITYSNSSYVNVAEGGESKGAEVSYSKSILGYDLASNITYTEAKLNNGNEKLRRPTWVNNSSISKNINDLNYKVSMNYYGDHKDIDSSTFQTIDKDSITTFDLELNQMMENKMFYLGLYNITDEKYEQPDGYNQLGINFQAGIRITM
tara:strand:+ start:254 stop:1990 length:1737 start_codon:yes stop_codon:yes gene_type:complete